MKPVTKRRLVAFTVILSALCLAFGVASCAGGGCSGCGAENNGGNGEETITLIAPEIIIDKKKGEISWGAVPNAESYLVYKDNFTAHIDEVTETKYKITETEEGEYEFAVAAYSSKATPTAGPLSVKEKYTVSSDAAGKDDNKGGDEIEPSGNDKEDEGNDAPSEILAVPTVNAVGNALNWSSVSQATNYKIYRDNFTQPIATITDTTYTMTVSGEYKVQAVKIIPDGNGGEKEYANSALSDGTTYAVSGKLATNSSVNVYNGNDDSLDNKNNYISIELDDSVILNKNYELSILLNNNYALADISNFGVSGSHDATPADKPSSHLDGSNFILKVKIAEHIIVIRPFSDLIEQNKLLGFNVFLSEAFEEDNPIARLATPVVALNGNAINWSSIENATAYAIYKSGEHIDTISNTNSGVLPTSYTLTESGLYTVTALGDGYRESEECSAVDYTPASTVLTVGGSIDIVATAIAEITLDSGVALGRKYVVTIIINNNSSLSPGIINIDIKGNSSQPESHSLTATDTSGEFSGEVIISDGLILEIYNAYEAKIGIQVSLLMHVGAETQIEQEEVKLGSLGGNILGTAIDVSELVTGDYTIKLTDTVATETCFVATSATYDKENDPQLSLSNGYQFYPISISQEMLYIYLYTLDGTETKVTVKLEQGDHVVVLDTTTNEDMNDGRLWVGGPEVNVTITATIMGSYEFVSFGDNVTDGAYNLSVRLNKTGQISVFNSSTDAGIVFNSVGGFQTKQYTVNTSYGLELFIKGDAEYVVTLKLEKI